MACAPPAQSVFTGVALLTLALAIGGKYAIFSVVNAACYGPSRIDPQERRVMDRGPDAEPSRGQINVLECRTVASQNQVFADIAVYDAVSTTLTGADGAEQIVGGSISQRFHSSAFSPCRDALVERRSRTATPGPD
jgi:hypothetical protein